MQHRRDTANRVVATEAQTASSDATQQVLQRMLEHCAKVLHKGQTQNVSLEAHTHVSVSFLKYGLSGYQIFFYFRRTQYSRFT